MNRRNYKDPHALEISNAHANSLAASSGAGFFLFIARIGFSRPDQLGTQSRKALAVSIEARAYPKSFCFQTATPPKLLSPSCRRSKPPCDARQRGGFSFRNVGRARQSKAALPELTAKAKTVLASIDEREVEED